MENLEYQAEGRREPLKFPQQGSIPVKPQNYLPSRRRIVQKRGQNLRQKRNQCAGDNCNCPGQVGKEGLEQGDCREDGRAVGPVCATVPTLAVHTATTNVKFLHVLFSLHWWLSSTSKAVLFMIHSSQPFSYGCLASLFKGQDLLALCTPAGI